MPGTWLAWIGGRLLHADTFALMLSPAIADLQFEAPARPFPGPVHYCAVLKAFAGALVLDLSADLLTLSDDLPTIGVLTTVQACYYGFMLVLLSGLGTERLATVDLNGDLVTRVLSYVLAIGIACVLTSSACFWPPRRTAVAPPAD
jgi:hypothetical protein